MKALTWTKVNTGYSCSLIVKSPAAFHAWCISQLEKDCKIKLKPAHKLTGYAPNMELYNGRGEKVGWE